MKQPTKPLWKKSMLQSLNLYDIMEYLYEISDNGDIYGYEREEDGESGYYQDYKEQFDELAAGAYNLHEAMCGFDMKEHWDDMVVALLGETQKVLGYDTVEADYFHMLNPWEEEWATTEATKRIERLSKHELIKCFRTVMATLVSFFDIKASHDCLTSIVEELDERGALLAQKSNDIDRLYEDLTGASEGDFDAVISNIPQRFWVE